MCCLGQIVTPGAGVLRGIHPVLQHLGASVSSQWPATAHSSALVSLLEPLYFRTLQYVLHLLEPLMRPWEVRLARADVTSWEADRDHVAQLAAQEGTSLPASGPRPRAEDGSESKGTAGDSIVSGDSVECRDEDPRAPPGDGKGVELKGGELGPAQLASLPLDALVDRCVELLGAGGCTFATGPDVTALDFGLVPALHMLLLSGYPLQDPLLGMPCHARPSSHRPCSSHVSSTHITCPRS